MKKMEKMESLQHVLGEVSHTKRTLQTKLPEVLGAARSIAEQREPDPRIHPERYIRQLEMRTALSGLRMTTQWLDQMGGVMGADLPGKQLAARAKGEGQGEGRSW
jgi:hypothetical protein